MTAHRHSSTRDLLRAWAPPLLALGLAATLVHPLDAQIPRDSAARTAAPVSRPAAGIGVSVPGVAFTEQIRVTRGRIRTAVLVNVAEPGGVASVLSVSGCVVEARPGVVSWLDCAYSGDDETLTVSVTLKDGRRMTHTLAPTYD